MDNTLEPIIVNPVLATKAAVIWLHGLGADGYDFVNIVPQLQLPDSMAIRFVFPHAPVRKITLAGNQPMRAWFNIAELTVDAIEDESGIRESQVIVEKLIARQIEQGVPSNKIVLVGFSQGGAMALHCGLRYSKKIAGILALSTWLPLSDTVISERHPANSNTSITMMHGDADDVLPISWAQKSYQQLQQLGYPVDFHSYRMTHTVCQEEIATIAAWLSQILEA